LFPKVSVVVPSYNAAAWLTATLESVLAQTYPREAIEIIVVDDASQDDSAQIARAVFERHNAPAHVLKLEKNGGVSAARNAGWKLASGEWIQFLDGDDLLSPHKIETQVRTAQAAPADVGVIYTNWQPFSLVGDRWQPVGTIHVPFIDDDPVVRILDDFAFGYVGPTLIRKTFIERVGGFREELAMCEDADLMLRLAMSGVAFRQAPSEDAAFLYRQRPGSLWQDSIRDVNAMRGVLRMFRRAEDFLRQRHGSAGLPPEARQAVARRYSRWAEFYVENDDESFRTLMGWLKELGFEQPTNLTPNLELLARLIGYEKAVRARLAYRRFLGRRK
jgi:glycosyltransferase involved in cell wall biosynthesis